MKGCTKRSLFKDKRRSGTRRLLVLLSLVFGMVCLLGLIAEDSVAPLDFVGTLPLFSDSAR